MILDELRHNAITILGKESVTGSICETVEEVNLEYAMVEELTSQLGLIPLTSSINIWPLLRQLKMGTPPEIGDLAEFGSIIEEISSVRDFLISNEDKLPLFSDLSHQMRLPEEVVTIFDEAFDEEGDLNGDKYPILGEFKKEIAALKIKIANTMKSLLQDQTLRDKLADSGFTEIDGRYCLMLKNTYKKGVGIVHGSSNTGRSLYVGIYLSVSSKSSSCSLSLSLSKTCVQYIHIYSI